MAPSRLVPSTWKGRIEPRLFFGAERNEAGLGLASLLWLKETPLDEGRFWVQGRGPVPI